MDIRNRILYRNLALIALVVAVVAAGVYVVSSHDVTFLLYLQNEARSSPLVAMLAFGVIHLLVVVLGLPGTSVLAMAAGYLFGFAPAAILVLMVTVAGSAFTYAWAARLARRHAERMQQWPLIGRIERLIMADPFHYLLLVRIVPVFPLFAVNVALALLRVGWPTFLVTSTLGLSASLCIYTGLGNGFGDIMAVRDQGLLALLTRPGFWVPLAAMVALIGASMGVRRRLRRGPASES